MVPEHLRWWVKFVMSSLFCSLTGMHLRRNPTTQDSRWLTQSAAIRASNAKLLRVHSLTMTLSRRHVLLYHAGTCSSRIPQPSARASAGFSFACDLQQWYAVRVEKTLYSDSHSAAARSCANVLDTLRQRGVLGDAFWFAPLAVSPPFSSVVGRVLTLLYVSTGHHVWLDSPHQRLRQRQQRRQSHFIGSQGRATLQ